MMYTVMNTDNQVIALFANFINYLNASYYEAQFTHKHEQARTNLNAICADVVATPDQPPTLEQCVSFYNDIRVLENVTETDDPDYHRYKRMLRLYIAELSPSILT
jgi:glutamate formiminotransferase